MLHDPGSELKPISRNTINLSAKERDVLRSLAGRLSGYAAQPENREIARLWTAANDLASERPLVWINEIPWHEMNVEEELTLQCEGSWAMRHEAALRSAIYQWEHFPADMVLDPFIACPLAISSTSFGIVEDVDIARTDESSDIVSRHFNIQITEPEDLEKIKMPVVTHDAEFTDHAFEVMEDLYRDIMPVQKVGQSHIWFTPWDFLIRWWGINEAMMDLALRPEMVHDAVERMVQAWMTELDQFEAQNLLSLDNNNTRVGSGGYGYVSELPGEDFDPDYVRPKNMWGCSNAQIFSEVSPEMHWDFAIEHDLKWLERWGLTYYGCCEPLQGKIHLLRKIPNLRKFSVSPWNDISKVAESVGTDYVLSLKPNPAIFLDSNWSPDAARQQVRDLIEQTKGCHVEIIMKDVSTVNYHPDRVWEWARIAKEEACRK